MMQAQPTTDIQGLMEQLQDIRPAIEPALWPPAPGWWIIAAIVLALLTWASLVAVRKIRIRARRQRLLGELEGLAVTYDPVTQPAPYLAALNRLFRGVALRAFPDTQCVRLKGNEWVSFIKARLPGEPEMASLAILETGPYQPDPVYQPEKLQSYARQWILNHG